MRRLTSVFTRVLPAIAVLGLTASAPVIAQSPLASTPPAGVPSATLPPGLVEPSIIQPSAVAPTPAPPGQPQSTTPPASAPRPEPRAPSISSQGNVPLGPVNIKLELTITDTFGGAPVLKSVSLLLLNGHSGMIRTTSYADGNAWLNLDAVASAYQNGQVSLRMTFEYTPARVKENANVRPPTLNESITVVLQDGKPLVVSQSADPSSDRKVTAQLTATILK